MAQATKALKVARPSESRLTLDSPVFLFFCPPFFFLFFFPFFPLFFPSFFNFVLSIGNLQAIISSVLYSYLLHFTRKGSRRPRLDREKDSGMPDWHRKCNLTGPRPALARRSGHCFIFYFYFLLFIFILDCRGQFLLLLLDDGNSRERA